MVKSRQEITPVTANTAPESFLVAGVPRSLNPLTALRRLRERRSEADEGRIKELSEAVARKVLTDITEQGMVSLFHDKETGKILATSMYSAILSSPKLAHLGVMVHRNHTQDQNNLSRHELSLGMIEHQGGPNYRALSIERTWDMPEGAFNLRFSVGGQDEGQPEIHDKSRRKVITPQEKIQFLEDILEAEVDVAATEAKFGAPYIPGGMRPHSFQERRPDENFVFSGYWVRDIADQVPALTGAIRELTP